MGAKTGDRVVCESERAAQPGRSGVIEEVLQEEPPRWRVRWDDGRETIFSPAAGVARIEKARAPRKRAKAKAKAGAGS